MKRSIYAIFIILVVLITGGCDGKKVEVVEQKDIKIHHFGNYAKVFNDLNPAHLKAAKKWGVARVKSREDAEKHKKQLTQINSCNLYHIDRLTHSIPYLVPRAKSMLDEIGKNFQDSLTSKGVGSHQIIVTSVLRSEEDVKKLRKVNGNASNNSAHLYGTTIDITYARFKRTDDKYPYDIPTAHLKHVLAEVLRDMQKLKKCFIKYEVRQSCFHITVR